MRTFYREKNIYLPDADRSNENIVKDKKEEKKKRTRNFFMKSHKNRILREEVQCKGRRSFPRLYIRDLPRSVFFFSFFLFKGVYYDRLVCGNF